MSTKKNSKTCSCGAPTSERYLTYFVHSKKCKAMPRPMTQEELEEVLRPYMDTILVRSNGFLVRGHKMKPNCTTNNSINDCVIKLESLGDTVYNAFYNFYVKVFSKVPTSSE